MKLSPLKLIPFVSIPALLISFQNCSKVGTNGISVDQIQSGQSADLLPQVSDVAMDTGVTTPPKNQDPANTNTSNTNTSNTNTSNTNTSNTGTSNTGTNTSNTSTTNTNTTTNNTNTSTQSNDDKDDKDCHEDRDRNPSGDKKQSEDTESNSEIAIIDAIKACSDPKPLSQPSDNLVLQFNHESIELDANSVSSIHGNWGRYVIIRAAAKENAKVGSVQVNHTTLVLCNFSEIKEIKGTHNRIIVVDGKIQEIHAINSNISLVNASVEKSKGVHSVIKSYSKQ